MTVLKTSGSMIDELLPGDRVPRRGLAMRGDFVYEDGRLLGVATGDIPRYWAVSWVLNGRGEMVEVRYQPIDEWKREVAGDAA